MTPGQLQAAYPGEYSSWKNSKSRCKKKGWPWASEWESFKGFLLSMGPKPTPAHTLDRKDSAIGEYGPGLCRWASKEVQNNNKSDNVKIVVPLTGEVYTPKKLAKVHGVLPTTIYKWIAAGYHPLELLAGKHMPHLHALLVKLDELPPPSAKKPARSFKTPEYQPPKFNPEFEGYWDVWEPTKEEYDHYLDTGSQVGNTRRELHRGEYDAVVKWIAVVNAALAAVPAVLPDGLPDFPQLKYYPLRPPDMSKFPLPPKPATAKPAPVDDEPEPAHPFYIDDDDDPADCDPGDECDADGE